MLRRIVLPLAIVFAVFTALAPIAPRIAEAHRSGCHRWHSCPSDTGSYVCGDLGYYDYCPNKPPAATPVPAPQPAPAPSAQPYGTYATGPIFQRYWTNNGGLAVFGYAKTPDFFDPQSGHVVRIFERNRLELHPENVYPYDIQLGLLGETRLLQIGRVWQNEPQATPQTNCRFFAETGHNLCEPFLSYWRAHGLELDGHKGKSEAESLALFGYPITEAVPEAGADGVTRLTQWFQRARFEDHSGEGAGILLGLLGNEVYAQQ